MAAGTSDGSGSKRGGGVLADWESMREDRPSGKPAPSGPPTSRLWLKVLLGVLAGGTLLFLAAYAGGVVPVDGKPCRTPRLLGRALPWCPVEVPKAVVQEVDPTPVPAHTPPSWLPPSVSSAQGTPQPTLQSSGALCGSLGVACPAGFSCTDEGFCLGSGQVFVPAGSFRMGCDPLSSKLCRPDEIPPHFVRLKAFALDQLEVTVEDYHACVARGVCSRPINTEGSRQCNYDLSDRWQHPINCVTWEQARRYCTFRGKRLPTEAEWEKAARGGDGRMYPWGTEPPDCTRANIFYLGRECGGGTLQVGSHPLGVSPYGAHDMIGNALEWTWDWYDLRAYYHTDDEDPLGPSAGSNRVLRGSSFGDLSHGGQHASARYNLDPSSTVELIGFRCASDVR